MTNFEEINIYKIRVTELNGEKRGMHYIPNIISIHPLDNLFDATDWIVNEATKDFKRTNYLIDRRRKHRGSHQKNSEDRKAFEMRLGSRTQGYVNQLCLMEDILIFEYRRFSELVEKVGNSKLFFNPKKDYQPLQVRLNDIRLFRNKVVAHTAYTYPWKDKENPANDDNPETIVRSILNLFPTNGELNLGGQYFSGFSKYKSQLPIISIFTWEKVAKPIFMDWKKLFIDRLKKIHKECPFENDIFRIDIATPHLVQKANLKSKNK